MMIYPEITLETLENVCPKELEDENQKYKPLLAKTDVQPMRISSQEEKISVASFYTTLIQKK